MSEITSAGYTTDDLLADRGKTHGDFAVHAAVTQALKSVVKHFVNPDEHLTHVQRESLEMVLHKVGRIVAGDPNFRDHWDDIAGYAKLAADRCEKPIAPEKPPIIPQRPAPRDIGTKAVRELLETSNLGG